MRAGLAQDVVGAVTVAAGGREAVAAGGSPPVKAGGVLGLLVAMAGAAIHARRSPRKSRAAATSAA